MGLEGPCPIHFTEEDISNHLKDGEGWNDAQDFWDSISGLVTREGYVTNERYEEARNLLAELRRDTLETMKGEERAIFEEQMRWAEVPDIEGQESTRDTS